jgi:hypothetical protein
MVKKLNIPGKCVFCGAGGLTKEHFWPEWASSLLRSPAKPGPHREEFTVRENKTEVVSHFQKERPGHITTKKLRIVCGKCNSGWMSTMESAVQPIATPMILGQSANLTTEHQLILARWAALKILVFEMNRRELAVTTQAERETFKTAREIPSGLQIWVAQCFSDTWCNAYRRQAGTLALPGRPRPADGRKNVHTVTFGIGQLFFFAAGSAAEGIKLADLFLLGEQFVPLWPRSVESIRWPPTSAIGDRDANRVAGVFDLLMHSPGVIWMP